MLLMRKLPSFADKVWRMVDVSLASTLTVACFKTWCSVLSLSMPFIEPCNGFCPDDNAATKSKQTDSKILFIMPCSLEEYEHKL